MFIDNVRNSRKESTCSNNKKASWAVKSIINKWKPFISSLKKILSRKHSERFKANSAKNKLNFFKQPSSYAEAKIFKISSIEKSKNSPFFSTKHNPIQLPLPSHKSRTALSLLQSGQTILPNKKTNLPHKMSTPIVHHMRNKSTI